MFGSGIGILIGWIWGWYCLQKFLLRQVLARTIAGNPKVRWYEKWIFLEQTEIFLRLNNGQRIEFLKLAISYHKDSSCPMPGDFPGYIKERASPKLLLAFGLVGKDDPTVN